jgi:hypothetical protein
LVINFKTAKTLGLQLQQMTAFEPKRLRSGAVLFFAHLFLSVLVTAAFSASHATLDPDRACNAAQDGTLWLSKAAIRPTQMMKAGNTFLCVRCVMFS